MRIRDLRIASKLLLAVLPLMAVSVAVLFLSAEQWIRGQRLSELTSRVEAHAATQEALLIRALWEFDEATVERLVASSARLEEIALVEVREVTGRIVATHVNEEVARDANRFRITRPLVHSANGQSFTIGTLVVDYHDGPLRRQLAEYRFTSGAVLLVALVLLGGMTTIAARGFVSRPLERLRQSLELNASGRRRERLVWSGADELGAVVDAYNALLDEVEQRAGELTDANRSLREERSKLLLAASVFENTIEAIVVTDHAGIIVSVNAAFADITGYGADEVVGRPYHAFLAGDADDSLPGSVSQALADARRWEGEVWSRRKDGTPFLGWATVSVIPDSDGTGRYLAVFNDITELRRKDEHIHHLAYHDPLTGLPNRRLLQDRLDHAIAVAQRNGHGIALIFIDVDQFKTINDSLGHEIGDRLLEVVADRLVGAVRGMDTVCRWGGDEFVVMVENCVDVQHVRQVADKIIASVRGSIDLGAATVHASISLGIALYPQDGTRSTVLMRNADAALFEAKTAGRDRYHFFDSSMNQRIRLRLELETELRDALERDQLELHYQPKFSISAGRLSGLEALVRWRHPEKGLIPPGEFIPLAEETGLVVAIGEWVLREACRQIKRWSAAGFDVVQVAVNLSARHVSEPALVDRIHAIVEEEALSPSLIEIEVTETAVMKDPERAIGLLRVLRDRGFGIAVDDFGTGYSNLSYLGKLPITTLKIDRSFVKDVENNPEDAEIVRTIVAMASALDLKLVAEGVESAEQLSFLERAACDVVQGYFIARPLMPKMVEAWLDQPKALNSVH